MAQISGNTAQRRNYPNKLNKVVNLAEIRWFAFEFTNSQGIADVGLAAAFGKDPKDGKVHIAIIEPAHLKELLTEPHPHIREGLRELMGVKSAVPTDLPSGIMSEDGGLGDVAPDEDQADDEEVGQKESA